MNIIIFGPQGSGKGTQAEILESKLNIPHISTGDIFREHMEKKTKLGIQINDLMNTGNLVPDDTTNQIIKNRLANTDCKKGFILDGYPRNLIQTTYLNEIASIDFAIEIILSDAESIKRISNRRVCSKCEEVYHLIANPPAHDNICDECGSKLIVRDDDKEISIKRRLNIYHKQTEPLINYYKEKSIYHQVDGSPQIKDVTKAILHILKM